ncbi:uncharacterized protein LOC110104675 isoform X12 [Dendrobium catenatum]|uniref:uncharacterized protein LOC110104675 isoform X12 n=1 Tax=Dendrobium catenatum TaxID=906689 RepID=UPI0010A05D17|nr:uncharacterized protein LOC110104675 isoform X12 [Dendrobium catenatum]
MEKSAGGKQVSVVVPPLEGLAGGGTAYGWSDGGLEDSILYTGKVDPTKVPTADLLHVWCMPSTANIGQQEIPRPLENVGSGSVLNFAPCGTYLRETTAIWLSVDVPPGQPPGQYEGVVSISALKGEVGCTSQSMPKLEKSELYRELKSCLDSVDPVDGRTMDELVEREKFTTSVLRRILFSPMFHEFSSDNGSTEMMDEDALTNLSVLLKITVTVWDFTLPITPSLPAVIGISETVIEDRFRVEHGTDGWFDALDQHFRWLLQYRISPFFCRWGDSMRVLAYTCPWRADHPKSDEYYSNLRLAAYAVPYYPILSGCSNSDAEKDSLRKEVEILKNKAHWGKAYFYLWDEPLNAEQYEVIRSMSREIRTYAPDARVLTTYYCGPSDVHYAPGTFEAFVKVPNLLRPHTQIFCTSEWVLGAREDLVKDITAELRSENGEEWWTYVCMGPTDPHPNLHLGMRGTQHRAVMWRVWKEGGTGFLYWGANCYEKATVPSAEIRFRRGLPPGDGVLFYPGEVFSSSNEPVASARLERLLSGLQDIEYLKLYSSRYGREGSIALLEKTGVYLGPERYAADHIPVDLMRAEIYHTCHS